MPTSVCPTRVMINVSNVALTNMAAALTEFAGTVHRRCRVDLTNAGRCRLTARVSTAGAAGATLKAQYSTDESVWTDLTATLSLAAIGTVASVWQAVPAGAKGDVVVRVVGQGGDGAADPVIGNVLIEAQ
jgi:hypothetical protein